MDTVRKEGFKNKKRDIESIIAVLKDKTKRRSEPFTKYADFEVIEECFELFNDDGFIRAWYEKDTDRLIGVLAFSVVIPFWTSERSIVENLCLCLDDNFHGFQRLADATLYEVAKYYNCKLIQTGTFLPHKGDKQMVVNGYTKNNDVIDIHHAIVKEVR